jgi:hypothetical protein
MILSFSFFGGFMREGEYQRQVIEKIESMFPDCVILKNDSGYIQGIPDLSIFHNNRWGMLEVKISANASSRPNQEHYIHTLNGMSFAAFIYPENEEAVLNALQSALGS